MPAGMRGTPAGHGDSAAACERFRRGAQRATPGGGRSFPAGSRRHHRAVAGLTVPAARPRRAPVVPPARLLDNGAMKRIRFNLQTDIHGRSFLLQRVQPAMSGLMDGSLSTLAPIFAVVVATHHTLTAFFTGPAPTLGAGGVFHCLPFLIPSYHAAIIAAVAVVAVELLVLAGLRSVFFHTSFARSFVSVTLGGAIIAVLSSALGLAAS